jgi:hypothetical protein
MQRKKFFLVPLPGTEERIPREEKKLGEGTVTRAEKDAPRSI